MSEVRGTTYISLIEGKDAANCVIDKQMLNVKTDSNGVVLEAVDVTIPFKVILDDQLLAIKEVTINEEGGSEYVTLVHPTLFVIDTDVVRIQSHEAIFDDGTAMVDGHILKLDDKYCVGYTAIRVQIEAGATLNEKAVMLNITALDIYHDEYTCSEDFNIVANKKGEAGNGIVSITRKYARSSVGTSSNDTTPPSGIDTSIGTQGWADGSPTANEQYPYLWVKETVDYTDIQDTTKYYCMGARGGNGIDAQDVEWAYIRTKTNVAPEISGDGGDNPYTDHNGKTYTSDDHLPKVVAGAGGSSSDIEDNNSGSVSKPYECTDDPKGVDDTWQFEWEIKRSKGNANNGHRSWNYYSGVMTLHNNFAASAYIIDTDNDNDQFGTDSDSKVVVQQERSTKVTLFDGSTPQTLATLTAVLRYEDDTPINDDSVAYYTADTSTGVVKVTIPPNNTAFSHTAIKVVITATDTDNRSKQTTFTIRKVKSGQPGITPTIYQLNPSNKEFVFERDASNNLIPANRSAIVNALKYNENGSSSATQDDGLTFTWGFDEGTQEGSGNVGVSGSNSITVTNTQANAHYQVWIQLSTGDRETLPIVKAGTNAQPLRENLIDNSEAAETFNVSSVAPNENDFRFYQTAKTIDSDKLPAQSTKTSGQIKVTISGCAIATGQTSAEIFFYVNGTDEWPKIAEVSFDASTLNGVHYIKSEDVTFPTDVAGNVWSKNLYIRLRHFASQGTVTIERAKYEVGERCSEWSLSENDKKGEKGDKGDDALSITITPDTLAVNTDEDDVTESTSQEFVVSVYRGGKKVSVNDYVISHTSLPNNSWTWTGRERDRFTIQCAGGVTFATPSSVVATVTLPNGDSISGSILLSPNKQGATGENSISLALDNAHEDFIYSDSSANPIAPETITSQARLYDGSERQTSGVSWYVSCDGGSTYESASDLYTTGSVAKAKISSNGLVTVAGIFVDSAKIKVCARYNNHSYYAELTINKTKQDKYDLKLVPDAIAFNSSGTWSNKTITPGAERTDLQGNKTTGLTIQTTEVDGLRLYYSYVNADGSLVDSNLNLLTTSTFLLISTPANTYTGIYFELRLYNGSNYRMCDYETVEIVKTTNGAKGDDAWTFDVLPNIMEWGTNSDGKLDSYVGIGGVARAYKASVLQTTTNITAASGLPLGFTLDISSNNGFSITPHEYYTTFVHGGTTVYLMKRLNQYDVNDNVYDASMMKIGHVTAVDSSGITVAYDTGGSENYTKSGVEVHVLMNAPAIATLTLQSGTVSRGTSLTLVPNRKGANGTNGASAIHLDLDNEHDAIQYAGTTKVGSNATSQATLYNGGTPIASSDIVFDAYSHTGIPNNTSGAEDAYSVSPTGVATVKKLSELRGVLVVKATYNQVDYYKAFTVDKVINKPKYEIKLEKDIIAINTSDNPGATTDTDNVKVYKTVINSDGATTTSLVTSLLDEGLRLFVQDGNYQHSEKTSYYGNSGYTHSVSLSLSSVTFFLTNSTATESTINANLIDKESVPVVKVQNGQPGAKGDAARQPYEWGLWSDFASDTTQTFTANPYEAPYFIIEKEVTDANGITQVKQTKWQWVGEDGTYNATQAGTPSSSDPNWELMVTDFKYLISEAMMADYGKFGAGIFSKDYAFSQYGRIDGDGSDIDHYKNFRPEFFKGTAYTMFSGSKVLAGSVYYDTSHMYSFGEIFLEEDINYTFSFTFGAISTNVRINLFDLTTKSSIGNWALASNDSRETHPSGHGNVLQGRGGRSYLICMYCENPNGSATITGITVNASKAFKPNFYIDWRTGEVYGQLGRFVNVIVEGVINNLIQEINDTNKDNYGFYNANTTVFWLNSAKVGTIIYNNVQHPLGLPSAFADPNGHATTFLCDTDGHGHQMSLSELRQCIGKKIYVLTGTSGAMLSIFCGLPGGAGEAAIGMLKSGDTWVYQYPGSGHTSADVFYVLECKMGEMNQRECIYWEIEASFNKLSDNLAN